MEIKYQEEMNELLRMEKQCLGPQGCSMESMKRNSYKAHCLHIGIVGIKALQEQAEREKGCEYCNNERAFEIHFSGEKAGIAYLHKCSDGWGLFLQMDDGDTYYTNVVNCPMCGKRLTNGR